jgi:hypothetical protein
MGTRIIYKLIEINNSFTTGYNIACPHYACIDHIETLNGIEYKER